MTVRILTVVVSVWTLLLLGAVPAAAVADVTPARVEGEHRVATAAEVARLAFPAGTDRAVIATSEAAPDALAAMGYAGALGAAVLLTRPDELPPETEEALQDLGVDSVTVVGGASSVSAQVVAELEEAHQVERVGGDEPWLTAVEVARRIATAGPLPEIAGLPAVFLANEERFADALASSTAAYRGGVPVLYTSQDSLREEVAAFLQDHDVERVVLFGGRVAVSQAVAQAIIDRGVDVLRLSGPTRVETSVAVAQWTADEFGFDLSQVLLARGDAFPDALTSGQLGGVAGAPIVLSASPTVLPPTAVEFFVRNCPTIEVIQAVGGTAAVDPAMFEQAVIAAESCAQPGDLPLTQTCTFEAAGFEIDVPYPEGWHPNSTEPTPTGEAVPPCRVFHHEPFELPRAHELTAYDFFIHVDRVPFDDIADFDDPMHELLSSRSTTIEGRRALVRELRATEDGLTGPAGARHYLYAVELTEGRSLVAVTYEVADLDYPRNKQVLDRVMARLTIRSDEPPDPLGEERTSAYQTPGFPDMTGPISYLTDVRAAAHEGFDRVVLEFAEAGDAPEFAIRYEEPPVAEAGSGRPIEVDGEAVLHVDMMPASAVDRSGAQSRSTYDGPERFPVPTGEVVTEVVMTGDFEAVLSWAIGLEAEAAYGFEILNDPLRLVIDVRSG